MIAIHPETGLKLRVLSRERTMEGHMADGTAYSVVVEKWLVTESGQPVEVETDSPDVCYIHTDTKRVQCVLDRSAN